MTPAWTTMATAAGLASSEVAPHVSLGGVHRNSSLIQRWHRRAAANVVAAGHNRCIVPIRPEHVEAWLNPDATDLRAAYAILADRERPAYGHRLAA